jgi:hypothetical protein
LGFRSLQHFPVSKVHSLWVCRGIRLFLGGDQRVISSKPMIKTQLVHTSSAHLTTVPPSGFGYPLDGLLPSIPGRFCFTPPALLGFSFGVLPSAGSFGCSHPSAPTYRFSCRCSRHSGRAGLVGRGSWVFSPAEVPFSDRGFSTTAGGDSPGFCPFQGSSQDLDRDFARSPLTRFPGRLRFESAGRRLRVSIGLRLARPRFSVGCRWRPATDPRISRTSHPLRVSAPTRSWHSGAHLTGLCVRLSP